MHTACFSLVRRCLRGVFALLVLLVFLPTLALAQTTTWKGGPGNWNDLTMWTNGLPSLATDALIDNGNPLASKVTVNGLDDVANLTIDSDDTVVIADTQRLSVYGTSMKNAGTLSIKSATWRTDLDIKIGTLTLSGGGTVWMPDSSGVSFQNWVSTDASFPVTLTNKDNTIAGAGELGGGNINLVNQGTIAANGPYHVLRISLAKGTNSNSGLMGAVAPGTLLFWNSTIDNTGGTIKADGGTVQIAGSTITNGTLVGVNGGTVGCQPGSADAILGSVTINGDYLVADYCSTQLSGTITSTGMIRLDSEGNYATLQINGNVTLQGGGTVNLSHIPTGFTAYIGGLNGNGNDTLTNLDNIIQGIGYVGWGGLFFVNKGVIRANRPGTLQVQPYWNGTTGFTNQGILEASHGGTLVLNANKYDNTGGAIRALDGSTVQLNQTLITGGTLSTAGTGVINTQSGGSGATLTSLTNAGNYQGTNGTQTTLSGTINNTGTLWVGTSAPGADFYVKDGTNLTGKGSVILASYPNSRLYGDPGAVFTNLDNAIQGAGQFGLNALVIVNNGSIYANAGTLEIRPYNGSGKNGLTNNGSMKVSKGCLLNIMNGPFKNFVNGNTLSGGSYVVAGTLQFDNANLVTNAANLTFKGPSSKILDQYGNNALAHFAANSAQGQLVLEAGNNLLTAGGFQNAGSVYVSPGSSFTVGGSGSYVQTAGTTAVDGTLGTSQLTSFRSGSLSVGPAGFIKFQGGTLAGTGQIVADVQSLGGVFPGDSITSPGALAISGRYTQGPSGGLAISIAAPSTYGQLNVSGAVVLGGTLIINLLNGFVPPVGSTFTILNCSSRSGTFSSVRGAAINKNEHFVVAYSGAGVTLQVVSGHL